jgi:hypothetical protein
MSAEEREEWTNELEESWPPESAQVVAAIR